MAIIVVGSGRVIDLETIEPEDISIVDIGHALSNTCRWLGHCNHFYSVAQHSVLVSRHVPPEYALWGLLHDAAEAYLTDFPAPIKSMFPAYKALEDKVMKAICQWADLPIEEPYEVKLIDRRLRVTESITLGLHPHLWGGLDVEPLPIFLQAEPCCVAKDMFFERWRELVGD